MELSQRLDLAKLGLDPDLVPDESFDGLPNNVDATSGGSGGSTDGAGSSAGGDMLAQLAGLLARVNAIEDANDVDPNDTFDSLGVDSLTRIELAVRAEEHFGVRVDEENLDPSTTLGDIAQFFAERTREAAR